MRSLLLTPWYFPHKILRWEDAVTMVFKGTVDVIVEYDENICSPSVSIKAPAVIRLRKPIGKMKKGVKFSRINVYSRDKFTCQYCRNRFREKDLSYDHVVPRKSGGKTEWDNIVTACVPCNMRKADRTCDESGMFPLNHPVRPKVMPLTPPRFDWDNMPEEWHGFCTGVSEF